MRDKYIARERIEKFFDGIYDCADLTFEPNDHCCAADDCAHCKWREAKNAIEKRILSIPAADVRPVGLLEQVEWERDTALAQLAEIGKGLGEKMDDVRPVVLCRDCRHRDPEDHKCDSGQTERQGCPFPVHGDYFCAYGER